MSIDVEVALKELRDLAVQEKTVVYNIHFCNAGIGIEWHEQKRVKTQMPPELENPEMGEDETKEEFRRRMVKHQCRATAIRQLQTDEGRVTYKYYPTLSDCIVGEIERVREVLADG